MSKETDSAFTATPIFARLGPISSRMQPAFEDAVSKLAGIPAATGSLSEVRASSSGIMKASRIASSCLLTRVSERALGPVVASSPHTTPDLKLIHSEFVTGIRVYSRQRLFVFIIRRKILLQGTDHIVQPRRWSSTAHKCVIYTNAHLPTPIFIRREISITLSSIIAKAHV
jgi:hypothetical protein